MSIRSVCTIAIAFLATTALARETEEVLLPVEEIPWAEEAPDQPQRLGKLWGDRSTGPAGTLLKVPGGFRAPVHSHTADYRAVVIEGTWKHWFDDNANAEAVELHPGSYWTQRADRWHRDACVAETTCTILLINTEPYATVVK